MQTLDFINKLMLCLGSIICSLKPSELCTQKLTRQQWQQQRFTVTTDKTALTSKVRQFSKEKNKNCDNKCTRKIKQHWQHFIIVMTTTEESQDQQHIE